MRETPGTCKHFASVHSTRPHTDTFQLTSSRTVHTYKLFDHVHVWYVARGPDHSRHAFIDKAGGVGHIPSEYTCWQGPYVVAVKYMCRGEGEIRGGSNDDTRIAESERENTRETHTMRIYANEKQTT